MTTERAYVFRWRDLPKSAPAGQALTRNNRSDHERMADNIRRFWRSHGFDVRVEVIGEPITNRETIYRVRSDLINGLPRNATVKVPR